MEKMVEKAKRLANEFNILYLVCEHEGGELRVHRAEGYSRFWCGKILKVVAPDD